MIPVEMQPEPEEFDTKIRSPGSLFLKRIPNPSSNDWDGKEFWQRALPDMRIAYRTICSYCAHWIPHSTGAHSIDHFLAKSLNPELAYEWSNFRYVSARFNSRKGTHIIVDPFTVKQNWFMLDLTSFMIFPSSELHDDEKGHVQATIDVLKLNSDDDLVRERAHIIETILKMRFHMSFWNGRLLLLHMS